jgi:predicted transcriptional regulator YdeE
MEKVTEYFIDKDITVLCVTASSFPEGVQKAHQKLHSLLPPSKPRTFYGISYANKEGSIVYRAAAEEVRPGEAEKLKLEKFVIRKGRYISQLLEDWRQDELQVGKTFKKLLSDPRIDKNGYCLEIYLNEKDMRCLVLLEQSQSQSHGKENISRIH